MTIMFDDAAVDLKSIRLAIGMIMGMAFFDIITLLADKELSQMPAMAMITGYKGIERFNPVNEAEPGEKFQSAINRGRFG